MADPLTGAGVGVLFQQLYAGASKLTSNNIDYEPLLGDLKKTLAALNPLIQNIYAQNRELHLPNEVTENLKNDIVEGLKLIHKYSETGAVAGCLKKSTTCTTQIRKLDDSLRRQLEILPTYGVWVTNNIHNLVTLIAEKMDIIPTNREPNFRIDVVCYPNEVEDQSSLPLLLYDQNDVVVDEMKSSSFTASGPIGVLQVTDARVLFNILYDSHKKLISKSVIYRPLKNIQYTLESYEPLIKQIEASNGEFPQEEEEKCKADLKEGIKIVQKLSKVKWDLYKKLKYANQHLGWDGAFAGRLSELQAQGVRAAMSSLTLEAGVDYIATVNRDMEKTLSGIEMRSEKIAEGMYRIEDQLEIGTSIVQAGFKRIEDRLEAQNGAKDGGWCVVPELTQFTVGLDEPSKELKMKLLKDGVSMLVVTAPGGCGKTTLATKFCRDPQVKDEFKNNIFFVNVSNTLNLSLIVQELYQRKGSQVPNFQDEITAVQWLQTFLKEQGRNPLLLILDDVRSGSESLLDKFQFEMPDYKMPNYKILVTSVRNGVSILHI